MSTGMPPAGHPLPRQYQSDYGDFELRNGTTHALPRGMLAEDSTTRIGPIDTSARFRQQGHLDRTASPLARAPVFSPGMFVEASRSSHPPGLFHHAASPPPKAAFHGTGHVLDLHRPSHPKGPLDFAPSGSPVSFATDRPHSSLSEKSLASRDVTHAVIRPMPSNGAGSRDPEFSIFIGDLSPDLREEDLVTQFLQPPPWPPQHPFAIAHAHAQQMQGIYQPGARVGPAPFLSTKSAKIMTDSVTGASKGYGFVRFTKEGDCNRALVEMQGVVISPSNGLSPGRPLRVSTATPKSRTSPKSTSTPVDGHPHPLQMPKPHHAVAGDSAAYLLQHAPYGRNVVSPQPRSGPPAHMMSLASPVSPTSSFEAGPGTQPSLPSFHAPQQSGFSTVGDSLDRTVSPPSARTYTPVNAGGAANPPKPSALDPNNTTVFVGGLSSLISEDTLRQFFEPYGEITYVKIPPGKGCGFVQFVRKADAERAINLMNGFPVGNARIRLSWGRSQGDKAAAAAAQAVAQATQLGHLAGLAGLGALSPSQLAQLAGLGSAISAAQANANRSTDGQAHMNGGGHAAFSNDPLSTLARQLAAVSAGPPGSPAAAAFRPPPMYQHAPPPTALHHQPQLQHPHPNQPNQHHAEPHPVMQPPRFDALDAIRQHPHLQQDYEQLASLHPSTLQQLLARSNGSLPNYAPPQGRPNADLNGPEHELVQAFGNLHFDGIGRDPTLHSSSYRPREASNPSEASRSDHLGPGYNRDPTAFLFSPFSPADSPVVGGKTELPYHDVEETRRGHGQEPDGVEEH